MAGPSDATPPAARSWAGSDPSPEFPGGLTWFNVSAPPTIAGLRGKVVLLDFWTLGCINCQHIIPDLKRLEGEFGDALVVIGVHSGKYDTEHDDESIRAAVKRYGLEHAVVNDPDFAVWRRFGATAWPTLVLIDPAGNLVGGHAGEGVYPLFQPILASLVAEFEAKGQIDRTPVALALDAATASTVLSYPAKVLADEAGQRLFIADSGHNRVLVATLDGRLERAIGTGAEGFADGAAEEAAFRQPQGLALSPDGTTLYVADTRNHAVRAMDLGTGRVRTIAGTGQQLDRLPRGAAPARQTALASPWDVLVHENALYISMAGIHQIWAMDLAAATISVFAGTSREGIDDGNRLTEATLAQPSGLTTDGRYLYWVDPESSSVRRAPFAGDGEVDTLAGTGLFDFGDRDGSGSSALLQHPQGIAYVDGTLYVGDTYNHKLRTIDAASFRVGTAAGTGERGWSDGAPATAMLDEPGGLSAAAGRLYIADTNNHLVRTFEIGSGLVGTLRLSNIAVAAGGAGAGAVKVSLAAQHAAPGAGSVRIRFAAPEGYKLNSQAPSRLTLSSSNPGVIELGEETVSWSSDAGSIEIPVPAVLGAGAAVVTAVGPVYYCRGGEEALCFIQQLELTLPVTIDAGSAGGEIALVYTLPATP
ncbi:MAG: thioredoxin-like domain-containing protein [Tepidiformaceae bacterium]